MIYQVGDTIGKYTIVKELGSGTFGEVYLVEWPGPKGQRQGALKILKDPKFKDILEEVSAWARVSHHPNILTFYGATEHSKQILLISEFAPDGTLEDWVKTLAGKQESIEDSVRLMIEILGGLEHLHDYDIVHRDIKPANILLKGDAPLLADFGLARGLDLVQSSILGGTLLYMSPELVNAFLSQGLGTPKYERTEADDLWASAVTFHQMLAGHLPFKSLNEIVASSPGSLPSHILKELRDVVEKSLQKNISLRFGTAKEMREALKKAWDSAQQREELSAQDYFNRGYDCGGNKDYDGAIENYSRTIELNPQDVEAYNNRGNVYKNKGNYDQAIKDYSRAIELNPQCATAYYNRGATYNAKGNYDQAIKDFNKAIELNPNNAKGYNNRGCAY